MAKSKRYDEGGVTEGENAGIGDDTRARAMKYIQDQADSADMEEPAVEAKPSARAVKAAKVAKAESKADARDAEAGSSRGIRGDGEPKTTMGASRARTREELIDAIPTGGKKGAGPTAGNGNSVDSTETSRNISNTLNAITPGGARAVRGATATVKGVQELAASRQAAKAAEAAKATRAARTAKVAPRAAREAKTLNPNAWMAGPKGMKENFKSGGITASSRADGIATKGKTRCRIC